MKIALVGSAPSSVALAPFDDPEWKIWGCSPGAYPYLRRLDAFFEFHRWRPGQDGFSPQYIEWMSKLTCPVYTLGHIDALPNSVPFPHEEILAQYPGLQQSFFTSSLAWMLAFAIREIEGRVFTGAEGQRVEISHSGDVVAAHETHEIGLWGVDMAAHDEYFWQKPGCHYFILEAEKRGIKVCTPPQSDLLRPIPLYAIGEASPKRIKLETRQAELRARHAHCMQELGELDAQYQAKLRERCFIEGALDDMTYHLNTWIE